MSRRHSPTASAKHLDDTDYKQLYLDCKHNVAVFMEQVERQITTIIQQHQLQKQQLQQRIKLLQQQLHSQPKINSAKQTPIITRQHTEQQESIIPSTFIRSKGNSTGGLFNYQPQYINSGQHITKTRNSSKNSMRSVRNSSGGHIQKENAELKWKIKDFQSKTTNLIQLHPHNSVLALRRAKKLKEIADSRPVQKVQNITDLLKSIRNTQHHRQEQARAITVLTPQIFSSAKTSRLIEKRKV